MTIAITVLRLFLGLFLLANGLNFWLHLLPITPPDSEAATRLMDGLVFSGLFAVVKYVEVGAGLLLLANRFVPLALALMLPLTTVIAFVDFVLIATVEASTFGALLVVPHIALLLVYLRYFLPVFVARSEPALPTGADIQKAVLAQSL